MREQAVRASFFFCVGPDNMGRHLWRLLKPGFLLKMLRSNAGSLYGWDILLRGTMWPGPQIGKRSSDAIRAADLAGHEVGLHAWDHYLWQARMERMSRNEIGHQIKLGMDAIQQILDRGVDCSAAAGWKCNDAVLLEKSAYPFRYNSDCRGSTIFQPVVDGVECAPQIPVTLPTYDEMIGRDGVSDANYNERLLSLLRPGSLNVLTIHAEVEGIARSGLFIEFLALAKSQRINFVPLAELLPPLDQIPRGAVVSAPIGGREGRVCQQAPVTHQ